MKPFVLAVAMLGLSCVSAFANALHLNPAQASAPASMETFGRTTIPFGYYSYCQRYGQRCAASAGSGSVSLTPDSWKRLIEVNDQVNFTVRPATDMEIYGEEERWELPGSVGDCEEYVLGKRQLLVEAGFPLGALLITVGRDAKGGGHAVLTVVTDRGDFILDNLERRVLLWRDAEIQFLKRQAQTDPNTWVSLVNG